MKKETKNCAIYCRKSTEEGLDMNFNTLDAQREACEAYINSQKSEGWKAVKVRYNDGGFSGGNMDRPALQKLLTDIKDRKVDIVVVYKIDRLTRSLMDFSKLVEIFDEYSVTFVSVTQSFNTTTSMGRLTLNVLLSFAQFEREVSAERIRDKFAASKKKGMWMGGNPPVGYEVKDRQLVINREGAKIARYLFDQYLELGCVSKLKHSLDRQGIVTQERVSQRGNQIGGKRYSRGALYSILKNPIYIGKIRHKEKVYDGLHIGIIPEDTWNAVQEKLKNQAATKNGNKKSEENNLLKGLLFDSDGIAYSPHYTNKKNGTIYRYYISQNLLQYRDHPKGVMARLPAHEIEKTVCNMVELDLINILALDTIEDHRTTEHIKKSSLTIENLVRKSVKKIIVGQENLSIEINVSKLRKYLEDQIKLAIPGRSGEQHYVLSCLFTTRRAHKGTIIIEPENAEKDLMELPPTQLKNLVRGVIWRDQHFAGISLRDIAKQENMSEAGVRKIIMGSFDTLMSL
ncbi:MAG: recombinase family protein [Pseudomonadota bacterium]